MAATVVINSPECLQSKPNPTLNPAQSWTEPEPDETVRTHFSWPPAGTSHVHHRAGHMTAPGQFQPPLDTKAADREW